MICYIRLLHAFPGETKDGKDFICLHHFNSYVLFGYMHGTEEAELCREGPDDAAMPVITIILYNRIRRSTQPLMHIFFHRILVYYAIIIMINWCYTKHSLIIINSKSETLNSKQILPLKFIISIIDAGSRKAGKSPKYKFQKLLDFTLFYTFSHLNFGIV